MSVESRCVGMLLQLLEGPRSGLSKLVIYDEDARHWQSLWDSLLFWASQEPPLQAWQALQMWSVVRVSSATEEAQPEVRWLSQFE